MIELLLVFGWGTIQTHRQTTYLLSYSHGKQAVAWKATHNLQATFRDKGLENLPTKIERVDKIVQKKHIESCKTGIHYGK